VPPGIIEDSLIKNWGVEPEKATLLARLSRGRFGWAVSAAQDDGLLEQRAEIVVNLLDVMGADIETRFSLSTQLAGKFSNDRNFVFERLDILLDLWRDMLLIKTGSIGTVTNIDRIDELTGMAEGISLFEIRNFIRSIQKANIEIRQNANPRLVMEVLMLDVPDTGNREEMTSSDKR
jgi:DNA polymerase-3 subunit delta'